MYSYNPANNTAQLVHVINNSGSADISSFTIYENKLYFFADDGINGRELWMHDGTNTSLVFNLNTANDSGVDDYDMIVFKDKLYFTGDNGVSGLELYSFTDPNLGINNVGFKASVTIAPNPTSGDANLTIELEQNQEMTIQLVDLSGKMVWQKSNQEFFAGQNNVNLPLSNQASGIYMYVIKDTKGRVLSTGKVVRN